MTMCICVWKYPENERVMFYEVFERQEHLDGFRQASEVQEERAGPAFLGYGVLCGYSWQKRRTNQAVYLGTARGWSNRISLSHQPLMGLMARKALQGQQAATCLWNHYTPLGVASNMPPYGGYSKPPLEGVVQWLIYHYIPYLTVCQIPF